MQDKKKSKILVPIILLLLVVGVWFVKNFHDATALQSSDSNSPSNTSGASIKEDFVLNAKNVDMTALTKHNLPIIIDFGADSCIPCKQMAPVLVKLNAEMQDKAIIKFVDVWKTPNSAKDFPVQVIPTQVLYTADGKPYKPSEEVQKNIAFSFYSLNDSQEHAFTVHQGGLNESQMRMILEDMGVV